VADERGDSAEFVPLPTVADVNWQLVATGDVDGDGKADLIWRNQSTGESSIGG